ncbi:MAG: DNA circularization N-terminal domain-containing protein [Bradyrhizobium sp.]|uniref:DNA circularization N-terminal domain-containing protein n=1 Tax=Bradyrhizobium sp. TaxID=376 RepID=UPI003BEFE057
MVSQACRDWLKTLWPASYKGVPFYFESDDEEGGRDNVKHVFPHRDPPFIEDMGEALRYYGGTAYVHGDNADGLASALKAALASYGAGMLVVPYFGPVTVHCETFKRSTHRDQMGYVAFELKFVRTGAPTAFISVPALANAAFVAAESVAVSLGALFPRAILTLNQPDYVVAGAVDTLASAAAAVDVLRQSYPVDPAVSAKLRDGVASFLADLPAQVSNVAPPSDAAPAVSSLVALVRQLGDGLPAEAAIRAALELVDAFPTPPAPLGVTVAGQPYLSTTARAAHQNAAAASRMVRLAALVAYAEGVLRTTFADRPSGVTARGEIAERFETELFDTTGAENHDLFVAIDALRGKVIEWLTKTINTLAPVIVVESARIMPSIALGWALYGDPTRGIELVARNNVRHPSFMPRTIEALSR